MLSLYMYIHTHLLSICDFIANILLQLEQGGSEGWWCDYQPQVVAVTALGILHHVLFDIQDKKLAKALVNIYKKVKRIVLYDHFFYNE